MPHPQQDKKENPGIRLNRYLSNSGVCTRREADKLIAKGLVEVNGKVVTEMGYRVQKGEKVNYLGEEQNPEARKYILINKPKECTCSLQNEDDLRSIYDIIEFACEETLKPVLPLADNTTGVLLMTNDSDLTKRLTQVKNEKKEIWHAFFEEDLKEEDLEKLREGINLKSGLVKADEVHYANPDSKKEVGIEIHSLEKNVVKKMIEHLGYKIQRLDRVFFAGLSKKNVPRGKWRFLSKKEVQFLRMQ